MQAQTQPEDNSKKPHTKANASPGTATTFAAVAGYMTCSALMLIVNKLAVTHLPIASFVLLCQVMSSAIAMWVLGLLGMVEVDKMEINKIKQFWIVPLSFLLTIWANIKVLAVANVETFITFRACTPLLISIADYIFLGRELPSVRSWICLVVLLCGSVGYVLNDASYSVSLSLFAFLHI